MIRRDVIDRSVLRRSAAASAEIGKIVEAAFDVMAQSQSAEPSLREILRRAKLSTATFYKHFRSRDELLLLLLDEGSGILESYLKHRMDAPAGPAAKIEAWIRGFIHQAGAPSAADRTRPFAIGSGRLESAFPDEHIPLYGRLVQLVQSQIGIGNDLGLFASPDPDRDVWIIFDFTRAAVFRYLLSRAEPTETSVQYLVDGALRLIANPDR